jgi:hypothetical protein
MVRIFGREVNIMDKQEDNKHNTQQEKLRAATKDVLDSIRVRVTSSYLRQKGAVRLTLTQQELEQVARLVRAGKVLLNDTSSVSKNLRQAMSKLGVDTKGL